MIHLLTILKKNSLQPIGVLFACMLAISLGVFVACSNSGEQEEQTSTTGDEGDQICANPINLFSACGSGSVDDPFLINSEIQLVRLSDPANQAEAWDATACGGEKCHFKLSQDLDMEDLVLNGPIGNSSDPFHGSFNGNGHTISNLTVNLPATNNVGLFGVTSNSTEISNLGLVNVSITGQQYVGSLAGQNYGSISSSYTTGTGSVTGDNRTGGLVGVNRGSISSSYTTGTVSVTGNGNYFGGLVGVNAIGSISNSYATVSVTGNGIVAGLAGRNVTGSISSSYATGSVTASGGSSGGLVGWDTNGSTSNSYATSSVTGNNKIGSLFGRISVGGSISNSYATGSVTGTGNGNYIGGLVGEVSSGSISISNNYVTSSVTVTGNGNYIGGLFGRLDSNVNVNVNGTNYFVDNIGTNGIGLGSCTDTCVQQSLTDIRDNLNEGNTPLSWDPAIWGALGEAGSLPCLRNMPSGARSCP